jgi:hypothetical protein
MPTKGGKSRSKSRARSKSKQKRFKAKTPTQRKKVHKVMHEYSTHKLKTHGHVVKERDQAIAIALSEASKV